MISRSWRCRADLLRALYAVFAGCAGEWGRGRDQRLCCPITQLDLKQGNTFVLPLKLHLKYMYRKGFFPFIPSPNQCYRFSLYTGCASRYAPARSIAFGSFPAFARCDARPSTQPCLPGSQRGGDRVVVRYYIGIWYSQCRL